MTHLGRVRLCWEKKKKKKGITQPYSMAQHKTSADILRRSCAVFL